MLWSNRPRVTATGSGMRVLAALVAVATGLATLAAPRTAVGQVGDPEAGRGLFERKWCVSCHQPRGTTALGPPIDELRRSQGEMELAGRLWNHVPGMQAAIARGGAGWPPISAAEMADLMAYLRASPTRDPAPDLYKGQLVLLRKGCLKCHSLRREGGRVQPDLAEKRADYESAFAWAATMWAHNAAMATMAARMGIPYPRFEGDEMGNLLGFLRSAATGGTPAAPRPR